MEVLSCKGSTCPYSFVLIFRGVELAGGDYFSRFSYSGGVVIK